MLFLCSAVVAAAALSSLAISSTASAAPVEIEVVAMPHPDDEMEAWSQIQGSTGNYKVFAYFTRGDETSYCDPSSFSASYSPSLGETPTPYTPTGKWSSTCYQSRINSTLNFLNRMSTIDSAIPGGFSSSSYSTITLPDIGATNPGHVDNGVFIADRTVRVYNSVTGKGEMGKVLFFNLGDGDLTKAEVVWAIKSIMGQRTTLGLPTLPFYAMIGPFSHTTANNYAQCQTYNHVDHYAIHDALYNYDFGMPKPSFQAAATCAADPDYTANPRTGWISTAAYNGAFAVNATTRYRDGFFQKDYGWLNGNDSTSSSSTYPGMGWYANPSNTTQISTGSLNANSPFMKYQTFWQRYVR